MDWNTQGINATGEVHRRSRPAKRKGDRTIVGPYSTKRSRNIGDCAASSDRQIVAANNAQIVAPFIAPTISNPVSDTDSHHPVPLERVKVVGDFNAHQTPSWLPHRSIIEGTSYPQQPINLCCSSTNVDSGERVRSIELNKSGSHLDQRHLEQRLLSIIGPDSPCLHLNPPRIEAPDHSLDLHENIMGPTALNLMKPYYCVSSI